MHRRENIHGCCLFFSSIRRDLANCVWQLRQDSEARNAGLGERWTVIFIFRRAPQALRSTFRQVLGEVLEFWAPAVSRVLSSSTTRQGSPRDTQAVGLAWVSSGTKVLSTAHAAAAGSELSRFLFFSVTYVRTSPIFCHHCHVCMYAWSTAYNIE